MPMAPYMGVSGQLRRTGRCPAASEGGKNPVATLRWRPRTWTEGRMEWTCALVACRREIVTTDAVRRVGVLPVDRLSIG